MRRQLEGQAQSAAQQVATLQQRLQQLEQQEQQQGPDGQQLRAGSDGAWTAGAGQEAGRGGEAAAGLVQRVAALKAARDKLIAALDTQAAELERLSVENAALAQVCGKTA